MPRRCSVPGCRSNYRDKCSTAKYVSCYGFPSDSNTLKKWLIAIGRANFVPNYDNAVCAKHFDGASFLNEDMYRGVNGELKVFKFAKPKLKNDAVPSLFLGARFEEENEAGKTDLSAFSAIKEVNMPLSTVVNDLHHRSDDLVLRNCDLLGIDDTKTCMDFLEVEMIDPDDDERKVMNLDGNVCGSLELRTTNCVSGWRNCEHYLAKEMKNRDNGSGKCHKNVGNPPGVKSCELLGKRGFMNCVQKEDIMQDGDATINNNLIEQNPNHVLGAKCGKFVNEVMGDYCGGLKEDGKLERAGKCGISDRAGIIGILGNSASQNRSNEHCHEGAIRENCGDFGSNNSVFYGGNTVASKSEENCSLVVNTKGSLSGAAEKNDHARDSQAMLGDQKNVKKTLKMCGDITNGISGGGSCGGNSAVRVEKRRTIVCQENDDMTDANLSQCDPGFPVGDPEVKVGGKNRGSMKNLKKIQENGNMVLMDANLIQTNPGETNDEEFRVGDLDVKVVGGKTRTPMKNKTMQKLCGDSTSSVDGITGVVCGGNGVVRKKESGVIHGDIVLMVANVSQSGGLDSVGDPEVKAGGQNRGSEKDKDGTRDEGPSEAQEWEVGVKEELFRGLGLVPSGVLHDRSVDRRHCVTAQRRSESTKGPRSPPKTAVFYPPGTAMFDTERFIGEIQKRPAIYDVRSKVYSNRVAKLKYWHEVGKEMYKGWEALDQMERRTLVKELQIKWKSIRDHFMRQLKQNMNGEGPKKKKYVHFDQLQFLTANLGVKRPRHSYKPPKNEPEEEYMELTPELPEERHFSFMTSVGRPDYDEHEVPVAAELLPQQPEDLSYHPKDLSYHHHKELSYHKELEGDRMGNKMFLLSLLPIMERLPDHSNIRARLQLMEVLQTFVAHEDSSTRDFYSYHDEKQSYGDVSQQHSTASHSDSDT